MDYRLFIIDDSLEQQQQVKKLTQSIISNYHYPWAVFDIINFNDFYQRLAPSTVYATDIYLLDIDLNSYHNGLDFAKKINECNPLAYIIFLTNYDTFGIESINMHIDAFSYLLKKKSTELRVDLNQLFLSVLSDIQNKTTADADLFPFVQGTEKILIPPKEIDYCCSIKHNRYEVSVHTVHSVFIAKGNISTLQSEFKTLPFSQNLKSYLINYANVRQVSLVNQLVIFNSGNELELGSRTIRKVFKEVNNES